MVTESKIIFLIAIGLSIIFLTCCVDHCDYDEGVADKFDKPLYLHDRIEAKYLDSTFGARDHPIILLSNGFRYYPHVRYLWEDVQIGDSIIKDTGSLKIMIKRKGHDDTEYIYAECGGKVFK